MHRHNLSVTGGQDFLKYRFSLGYLDQDGIIAPSGHKRLNVRANVDAEVTKRLKVGVNFFSLLMFRNDRFKQTVVI